MNFPPSARRILLLLLLLLLAALPAAAQQTTPPAPPAPNAPLQPPSAVTIPAAAANEAAAAAGEVPMTNVQFPNSPIPIILLEYENLTGTRVIRDASVQDRTLSIQTSGKMTYPEAAEFIEKSFLLNGYAILPTDRPDQRKFIAYNTEKKPSSEGLRIFTNAFELPESEEVVTYIMPLSFIAPDEAAELFTNYTTLHPYGRITPLKSANAIVITENSSTIRTLIELRDHVDISAVQTESRAFQLERADAEDVVEALVDVLGLETSGGSGSSASAPAQGGRVPQPGTPESPEASIPSMRGGDAFARATSPDPKIRAIARANRVLVVATPTDMGYIEDIISHLDAPVETATYMRRKLKYIAVSDFLKIAGDAILRGLGDKDANTQISGGDQQDQNGGLNSNNQNRNNSDNSTIGSNNSGRSSGTGDLGNAGSDAAAAPQSLVVDKTLLIADNTQNMLIASGPPEHLSRIEDLLDTMDVRPEQIQISAVIAQLSLGDDFQFAANLLRTLEQPAGAARFTNGSRFNGGGTITSIPNPDLFNVEGLVNPANLATTTAGLSLYGQINRYLDGHLSAMEKTDRFKVLSRPSLYTLNNRQAVIETGQRVAVPRSTLSSLDTTNNNANNQVVTANIDYEDVVLRIAVVPLINADGEVSLQIQQRNDSIVGSTIIGGDSIPTIGTQALGTTVIVPDGGTVLLGGLITEDDTRNQAGLPLFMNLPLVGRVLGSTDDKINRQELLIYIQPRIIRNDHDQTFADNDLKDRTRVALPADQFATGEDNNLDVFETQDFNNPEKRVFFFRDLFKKKPSVRAIPIEP